MEKAILIYGPPGAGKGTQAELLARRYYFTHFDTGRYLENKIYSPDKKNNPEWQKAKEAFETGKLIDPPFVLKIVKEATERIADSGMSIVYSGSPRTLYEAFGEKNEEGLIKLLSKKYDKENIFVVYLNISEEESIARNSTRKVCSVCGLPILGASKLENCAFCGGKARTRTLDDPEIIKVRFKEFKERSFPILEKLKEEGFNVNEVDGSPMPYKVHEEVIKLLNLK
jgi:adenylate kinase